MPHHAHHLAGCCLCDQSQLHWGCCGATLATACAPAPAICSAGTFLPFKVADMPAPAHPSVCMHAAYGTQSLPARSAPAYSCTGWRPLTFLSVHAAPSVPTFTHTQSLARSTLTVGGPHINHSCDCGVAQMAPYRCKRPCSK